MIGSEMKISDGEQLHPDNERLLFREHFLENSVRCSTPLVRQLDKVIYPKGALT